MRSALWRKISAPLRPAVVASPLPSVPLAGLAGLLAAAVAACSHAPADELGQGGAREAEPSAEAAQALTSAQTCVDVYRGGFGAVVDAQINAASPTKNFGASGTMVTGYASGLARQSLLRFDLSGIPAGPKTNITSAVLSLSVSTTVGTPPPATVNVHQVTNAWDELSVTWQLFNGAYNGAALGSFSNAGATPSVSMPSALVHDWIDHPALNYGILLAQPGTTTTTFSTSDYPIATARPKLTVCFTVTCDPGFADCNGSALDGCEVDTTTSLSSCGACGHACSFAHAGASCQAGACVLGTCNQGFADCDGSAANGCEQSLSTLSSCGACGVGCALPNAVASCASGTCALVSCNAGTFDCDGDPRNGCEPAPCANGGHCAQASDCQSGRCQGGYCVSPACSDGAKNGAETDVDCGGGACPPCGSGLVCGAAADCQSGVCTNGLCQAPSCGDGVKNGAETGVDCGGGACAGCAAGGACAARGDCQSGVCSGGLCQAPACNDGVKNGNEASVDCGGSCAACLDGIPCATAADCQSAVCRGGVCQIPACNDGVKNGAETGVDCGGGACKACGTGGGCASANDCASAVCLGGACQAPTCSDGKMNGAEIGVDCGGSCGPCGQNQRCTLSTECADGTCVNGYCQGSCSDGKKNGNEWGPDCGGSCVRAEVCNGVDDNCDGTTDEGLGATVCGVGACQRIVANCAAGKATTCAPGAAVAEVCNGLDDNCDGRIDEGCSCVTGATQACYTGATQTRGVGACRDGVQTCVGGVWGACSNEVTPTAEACDNLDNDCNGQVDDGLGTITCGVGTCQRTIAACSAGKPQTCVAGYAGVESCNGLDDNCDGQVDNNLPMLTCGVGACQRSFPSCLGGRANSTCTPGAPSAEVCNGIDDNCNGTADEGNPGGNLACSTGKLGVCAAGTTACTGGQIACNQATQPSAETCNGLDDDCDGQVDQGNPGGGVACTTGKQGVCAAGTTVCSSGQLACQQTAQPSAETCNGLDDDCDGQVDEGNPGGGVACATGKLGVCAAGTTVCTGGQIACTQSVAAGVEVCDGLLDENCDGRVDEGCNCVNGATQPCYPGAAGTQGVGVCHAGTQTCVNGDWGACAGAVTPGTETCNGQDDDCNGQVDDGLAPLSCGVGQCARTVAACVGGVAQQCAPGAPSAELCDGLDNDCDGVVDDGNPGGAQLCDTGLPGVCGAGTTACVAGALQCHQDAGAGVEVCDGLDNDCNGQVDDGASDALVWYRDADGDGYGDAAATSRSCVQPTGYVADSSDCNDQDPLAHPGNGTCGGLEADALVCGGASMTSTNHRLVGSFGDGTGSGVMSSANHRFHGGLVGATQGP